MKKLFTFAVFLALSCLLGNRTLAQNQNQTTYTMRTEVKETIDFTGVSCNGDNPVADPNWDGNRIPSLITKSNDGTGTVIRFYNAYPIYVGANAEGSTSTTIYSGRVVFDTWASSLNFTISNGQFANANVDDIIRVNYTDKVSDGGENNYNPIFKYVGNWQDFTALQSVIENGEGYFQAVINQEALNELKNNGLRLQGRGFTLTSVELISFSSNPGATWQLWKSGTHGETYLQKNGQNDDYFNIDNLKEGDVVTIWGDSGNSGGCRVTSGNTNKNNQDITFSTTNHNEGQQITMQSDGTLQLLFYNRYSGIRKIEIKREIEQTTIFDYDPGYEEYDMYDEFSWDKKDDQGNITSPATTYKIGDSAGFQLNGQNANYVEFEHSKISTNNRIALTGAANEWTFDFGLVPPGTNGDYSYLSICNLREGDRVVISYINDESENPLIFASGYKDGAFYYDGCAAFKDDSRDGILNDGEQFVYNGYAAPTDWHRGEGNVGANDNGWGTSYTPELNYINSYVITEDGHLDLAFRKFEENYGDDADPKKIVSRIVKIKIFSDHQAMMIDEYDANSYWAKFNISGELQAKEHIMPGGLEIQVGNDDASQHALVVSSKDGPVSYVNAVDGFKIPGVSKNGDQVSINFDLGINKDDDGNYNINNLPTTGTFYKFIPEVKGKMKFRFEAKSMNYYRWDLKGNSVYQNTSLGGDWGELFDRPNEQTVDAACPYYLVKVKNGQIMSVQQLGSIDNGGDYETPDYIDVEEGEEYYLFGGWNQTGLYYNSSWRTPGNPDYSSDATNKQYNNIEFRPGENKTTSCGVACLLWVEFDPEQKIYPLAKWVPNGTIGVCDEGPGSNKQKHGVPNPDDISYEEDKLEYYLADLYGYNDKTSLTVKKMAGNITGCTPFLKPVQEEQGLHYQLMIKDITYASEDVDKGGTILIKIGDATQKVSPVYTLTIAYSGDPTFDGNSGANTRGHIWDYSSNSLHGLKYDASVVSQTGTQDGRIVYTDNAAVPEDYGHYFANYFGADISSYTSADDVLKDLAQSSSGKLHDEINSGTSEWMFNYNLVNDGKLYDPVFTNKYDLEADNADLIWDTEGTVIKASANASVMFNEYIGEVGSTTEYDPDRYVGILKGGEFRIPWLMPNDRVIIWMGTGKGSFNDHAVFNIRGAYDALHNPIIESDDYIVGGSQWNEDEKEYKGCYHFFAQGDGNGGPADMVFKMTTGSMCKIYKIQIYRGDRINTNEIVGATEDDKFLLVSTDKDLNDNEEATIGAASNWTLKYFGKKQQLANGKRGNTVQTAQDLPTQDNEIIAKTGKYSSATPALTDNYKKVSEVNAETGETEQIATSEVESFTYNHQLGDIGTIRVRGKDMEKNMNYVADYADHNVTIAYQETQTYPYTWDFTDATGFKSVSEDDEPTTTPTWYSSYDKSSEYLSLWVEEVEVKDGQEVKNGTFDIRLNSQATSSDKDNIFETAMAEGGNQVWADGQVIPELQGLLFYTDNNDPANNGQLSLSDDGMTCPYLVVPNVPANAAVYLRMTKTTGTSLQYKFGGGDLSAITNSETGKFYQVDDTDDYIVALLNPSTTSKANLTLKLDGFLLKKLGVSADKKTLDKNGWATESREHVVDPSLTAYLTGKDIKTYFLTAANYDTKKATVTAVNLNEGEEGEIVRALSNGDEGACIIGHADGQVKILDGGFHLFVPDMHDFGGDITSNTKAGIKTVTAISQSILKAQVSAGYIAPTVTVGDGAYTNFILTAYYKVQDQGDNRDDNVSAFYRVSPTANNKMGAYSNGHNAYLQLETESLSSSANSFEIVFDLGNDDTDGINEVNDRKAVTVDGVYTIDGQKLNGMPTTSGIYIVNGKKVVIK